MGKYFPNKKRSKIKEEAEKRMKRDYIPSERIASRIFNESMRPSNSKEYYPDYVQDWALMNKINQ